MRAFIILFVVCIKMSPGNAENHFRNFCDGDGVQGRPPKHDTYIDYFELKLLRSSQCQRTTLTFLLCL